MYRLTLRALSLLPNKKETPELKVKKKKKSFTALCLTIAAIVHLKDNNVLHGILSEPCSIARHIKEK